MEKPSKSRQRRGRGEGSVFRYRGRYRAVLSWTDAAGRRRQRVVTAPTLEEARRRLALLRADLERGELPSGRLTVGDWLHRWLEAIRPQIRPSTWRGYETLARCHLIPALGRIELRKLDPSAVERMTAALIERGLTPRTAAHARVVLRRALADAQRDGLVSRNAAAVARPPYVPTRALVAGRDYLEPDHVRRLVVAARAHPFGPIVTVAVTTGLRLGELLGLAWSDVDLEGRRLSVRRSLSRSYAGGFELAEPKTARSRRTIDLPDAAIRALERQRDLQAAWRAEAAGDWQDTAGLVFTDRLGRPLRPWAVNAAHHHILAAAGLPSIPFHGLRHSAATLMLAQGVPMTAVMQALGHSTVVVTVDRYAGLTSELRRAAADAIERALDGSG